MTEELLFHGTKQGNIPKICDSGFDFRLSGISSGTIYGKGSYFSKEAHYSRCQNFCSNLPYQHKKYLTFKKNCRSYTDSNQILVARVLAGRYTTGNSEYVRPPQLDEHTLYDSCVDNVENPKIFVIFSNDQVYPEYIIDYVGSRILQGTVRTTRVTHNIRSRFSRSGVQFDI